MPADPLAALLARPAATCVVTDFDGTLAPIVERAEDAVPLPDAPGVLRRLAGCFGRVAVVSGRPAAFLAARLGLTATGAPERMEVVGLYGLERVGRDGRVEVAPGAEQWRRAVTAAADEAEAEAPPGLPAGLIERKGLSVTFHWRVAPEAEAWVVGFAERAATRLGLQAHRARASIELRPPLAVDKGTAVDELVSGFAAACFLGDDLGDLPAFAALDRMAAAGGHTLKVAVRSREAPAELLAGADMSVDGPEEALGLLRSLAERAGG